MKLNKNFLVHKTGNDAVIVPVGNVKFSGVVRGNETLGAILDLLKKDTTVQNIVDEMMKSYDAPREVIEKDVVSTVENLRNIGAIDE